MLAFLLLLCALGAFASFAYWGFKTGGATLSKIGLGICRASRGCISSFMGRGGMTATHAFRGISRHLTACFKDLERVECIFRTDAAD